jgi:hypothetical protein
VVGRAVGNSVVRHRTVRQLRHLVRDRLDRLPTGSMLVVRALPPAAAADSAALGRDLDAALTRLLPTATPGPDATPPGPAVKPGPVVATAPVVPPGPLVPAVPAVPTGPAVAAGAGPPAGEAGR